MHHSCCSVQADIRKAVSELNGGRVIPIDSVEVAELLSITGQEIYFSLADLIDVIAESDAQRVLLVFDRGAVQALGWEGQLHSSPWEQCEFSEFAPNPSFEEALAASTIASENQVDALLAVGGGSCLDVAKMAALSARTPQLAHQLISGEQISHADPLPIYALPTTSGTGSEATHFAAIYVQGQKRSIAHAGLRPKAVALDVTPQCAMPDMLAAVSGLDAFCQAIESIWAVGANERSIRFAQAAARIIYSSIIPSVVDHEPEARTAMMIGSHLAGQAINISKTTAAHAISYVLTSRFGIPHGHAVALTVGHIAAANAVVHHENCQDPRGVDYVRDQVLSAADAVGATPEEMPGLVHDLMVSLGLPASLSELGIRRDMVQQIVQRVDPVRLGNNPRCFTSDEMITLLNQAW